MAEPVKARRRYDSSRRRAQAAATRVDILDAAQRRFEASGYAATTMEAIATEAGVALKTVYVAFETKSGLLRALWNHLLRAGRDETPVAEQEWYREVVAEPDPGRKLEQTARNSRVVKERIGGVLQVIRSAAPVDDDIAALWARIETEFHANQRAIVESMAVPDADRATDILWTLNHPDVWHLLVDERGWTPEQWERWFVDAARAQLLQERQDGRRQRR
jgi:AcrR family transcriptional regulator